MSKLAFLIDLKFLKFTANEAIKTVRKIYRVLHKCMSMDVQIIDKVTLSYSRVWQEFKVTSKMVNILHWHGVTLLWIT